MSSILMHIRARESGMSIPRHINAKIERFYRTLKSWLRTNGDISTTTRIQERLDEFLIWYNERLRMEHYQMSRYMV